MTCIRCVTPAKCAVHGCCPGTWPEETASPLLTQEDMAAAHRQADRDSDDEVDEIDYANGIERRLLHKLATMPRDQLDRLLAEAKNYIIDN